MSVDMNKKLLELAKQIKDVGDAEEYHLYADYQFSDKQEELMLYLSAIKYVEMWG